MVADGGNSPNHPSTTIGAVIGTTSATVIQTSPSMKLTRFTNQRPASNSRPRSIQSGQAGTILTSPGIVKRIVPTATACSISRGSTGMDLTSSANPTMAMNSDAAKIAVTTFKFTASAYAVMAPATTRVVPITAMPAPCGVGIRCDDRAFGFASACRKSQGRIAQVMAAETMAAATTAKIDRGNCGMIILSNAAATREPGW